MMPLLLLFFTFLKKIIRRQLPRARKASAHNSLFTRREVLSRYFSIKLWLPIDLLWRCRPKQVLTDSLQSIGVTKTTQETTSREPKSSDQDFFFPSLWTQKSWVLGFVVFKFKDGRTNRQTRRKGLKRNAIIRPSVSLRVVLNFIPT